MLELEMLSWILSYIYAAFTIRQHESCKTLTQVVLEVLYEQQLSRKLRSSRPLYLRLRSIMDTPTRTLLRDEGRDYRFYGHYRIPIICILYLLPTSTVGLVVGFPIVSRLVSELFSDSPLFLLWLDSDEGLGLFSCNPPSTLAACSGLSFCSRRLASCFNSFARRAMMRDAARGDQGDRIESGRPTKKSKSVGGSGI